MSIDANALLLSFAIGGVGFVCFGYGKRQGRWPQMLAGLILLIFPYFVDSVAWMLSIAGVILALLVIAVRLGW